VKIAKTSIDIGVFMYASKIHTIFEGTSEIQQLVIARAISGLRIE
jgi:alkylation response protein AidB-like acyl-CoA dehydrogenase